MHNHYKFMNIFSVRNSFYAVLSAVFFIQYMLSAKEIHVAPNGSPTNKGTQQFPLDIYTAFSKDSPAKPGDTLLFHAGRYELKPQGKNKAYNPFECAISGEADKPIQIRPLPGKIAQINGPLNIKGSYLHFFDMEIGFSDWDPMNPSAIAKKYWILHSYSVMTNMRAKQKIITRDVKLINCNIFGNYAGGVTFGTDSIDSGLYGCLIHDCGFGRTSTTPLDIGEFTRISGMVGAGYKGANNKGTQILKHNIFYRTCGESIAITTGGVKGFDIIENICSIAGARYPAQTRDSIMICANYGETESPIDRMRIIGNVAYQPSDLYKYKSNVRLTSYKPVFNKSAVVEKNYFMGAYNGLSLGLWENLRLTDNTIWATGVLVSTPVISLTHAGDEKGNIINGNRYIPGSAKPPFEYDGKAISFEKWQEHGMDKNGSLLKSKNNKPTGTRIFIFPNKYTKGRANIGIFNWDGHDSVEVDLSDVLKDGQSFDIYNVLDIKGSIAGVKPVITGKASGRKIRIPMRRNIMSPDFDAFLLLPSEENK